MNQHFNTWILIPLIISIAIGCKKNKDAEVITPEIELTMSDASVSIPENQKTGRFLLSMRANSNVEGNIFYEIIDQSVANALKIDIMTGQISIADPIGYDFEVNPEITATIRAYTYNFEATVTATATIRLSDEIEFDDGFITIWQTIQDNQEIEIPTRSGSFDYDYMIDWGDGSAIESNLTSNASHTYIDAGFYTIKIIGTFPKIHFPNSRFQYSIISIEQWGNIQWQSMEESFSGCSNLQVKASDSPDLTEVTSLKGMFVGCYNLTGDLSGWDVSNITDMTAMFSNAYSFDSDLSNWDVSKVVDMTSMFSFASSFNHPIGSWDVSMVNNMAGMFSYARQFDDDLGDWDIQNVTSLQWIFNYSGLSPSNYDNTLDGWSQLTDLPDNMEVGAQELSYCDKGASARNFLIENHNWRFLRDEPALEGRCD